MKKILIISAILMVMTGCSSAKKIEKSTVKPVQNNVSIEKKAEEKKIFKRNTSFELEAKGGKDVYLIGDMTEWEKNKMKLIKTGKDKWALNIMLEPGKYEYKFLIDGNAVYDEKSEIIEKNSKGETASYVTVEPEDFTGKVNPVIPHGIVEKNTHKSKIMEQDMAYNIYLPPSYDKNVKLPLLVLLHGYGSDPNQWTDGDIAVYMDNLISAGTIKPFAILMPSGGMSYYRGSIEDYIINEIIPFAAEKYNFDISRERCGIAGMSMGGFGAFYLGLKYSERFAVTVPLSMGLRGEGFEEFMKFAETRVKESKDKIIMSMYCGKDDSWDLGNGDTIYSINKAVAERMKKTEGIDFKYKSESGGHDFNYWGKSAKYFLKDVSDVICR